MAVELSNMLARSGGQSLPATLLFNYPTLDALADFLADAWRLDTDAPDAVGAAPEASVMSMNAIAELSDKEVEVLLLEELESSSVERRA
jgi:hypothetical protein